ncbi:MAG: ABC transporter substrate-binding protein [Thermodesulfobacteriota bacterium]
MKSFPARSGFLFFVAVLLFLAIANPLIAQVKELRIADSKGDWGHPNPYRHYPRGPGYVRMSWVFDTLVWKDQQGFIPGLAQSWSFDPQKLAFTFKLNPEAKWHDGRPLTAQDVVFSLEYYKKHPYSWISVDSVDRAVAEDPHTVTVYLAKAYSPFISDIGGTMPVLPKHIWEGVGNPEAFDDPKAYIGSGPYVFRDFNKAQGTYLYEAFVDYHQGRPKAGRIVYVRSSKPLVSLVNGEADLSGIQPEMVEPLRQKGMVIIKDEPGWVKKLMINHRKPPFSDKRFRMALAHAISQQEIVDKSQRGFARPAPYGLLSVAHDMYNPKTRTFDFSLEKARSLLDSMGYQRGTDGFCRQGGQPLKVQLLASSITVGGQSVADRDGEVIKKQLEAVGIRVDLLNLEQATTDSKVKNWDFELAVSGHGGISGDARILNEMISSRYGAGSVNNARYDGNPGLNTLLEDQMVEMDEARRKDIVFKIQQMHADDLPAICLYYPDSVSAYNPKKGVVWYYTKGGISKGIPIPQNKMSVVR